MTAPLALTMGDPAGIGGELSVRAWLARRAAKRAFALLPVSKALQTALMASGMDARYEVLPNVIDQQQFQPPTELEARQGFRLFHLSDFSWQKRIEVLTERGELKDGSGLVDADDRR